MVQCISALLGCGNIHLQVLFDLGLADIVVQCLGPQRAFQFDIFFCDIFTNIVTSLTCSCVTFTADIPAGFFLLFILIKTFRCTDCQITIFQFCSNFIFLEPWKINLKFISIFHFLDICLHQIIRMMSIELLFCSVLCFICISVKRKSKPIIIK